jgi:Skp family chaperone for outer membrane proteins
VLITAQGSPDVSLALTQVAKQAQQVIKEKAAGATVLIKQALVLPDDVYDITDSVLQHFGLPTDVPTVTVGPEAYVKLEDIAPSDAAFSGGKLREDYRLELDKKSEQLAKDAAKNSAQKNAVP